MFESIRGRFQIVQENLSASIRGLSTGDSNSSAIQQSKVNINAGCDLLDKYQKQWEELHNLAQENAVTAQEVDQEIGKLHKKFEKEWRDIGQLITVVSSIPQLLHSVSVVSDKLGVLQELFINVEKSLIDLEDLIEVRELQERQLDHRFQLALYKEKKLSELEGARLKLAEDHADKLTRHELRQQRLARERQDAFGKQFQQDLEQYKETQTIPVITKKTPEVETKLEELSIDGDEEQLNEFLENDTTTTAATSVS